jgi:hypothetical protein
MLPAPTQSNILAALRSFLVQVLPATGPDGKPLDVILAQTNRIPEPRGASFVTMTPTRFERIETNFDSYEDASFTGSIAGTTHDDCGGRPAIPRRRSRDRDHHLRRRRRGRHRRERDPHRHRTDRDLQGRSRASPARSFRPARKSSRRRSSTPFS